MDDNNNNKNDSTRRSFSTVTSDQNRTNIKVVKHFEPRARMRTDGAFSELPCVGVDEDDAHVQTTSEINPTARVRKTSVKYTVRATNKQSSSCERHSALTPTTSTNDPNTKPRRITFQYNYKKSDSGVTLKNRLIKNNKSKSLISIPNPNKKSESDSLNYISELKNEIKEFKNTQDSLTKAADDLKSEIREFRASLVNNDTKNTEFSCTAEVQTSTLDFVRDYAHLFYGSNKENFTSPEIYQYTLPFISSRFSVRNKENTSPKLSSNSQIVHSTTAICSQESLLKTVSNMVLDNAEEKTEFSKSSWSSNDSTLSSKNHWPYPNVADSFVNTNQTPVAHQDEEDIDFLKNPQDIEHSDIFQNSAPVLPRFMKFSDNAENNDVNINIKHLNCLKIDPEKQKSIKKFIKLKYKEQLSNDDEDFEVYKPVKGKNLKKISHKENSSQSCPVVLKSTSSQACESVPETHTNEESTCKECSVRNDQFMTIMEEQKKQMKVFSDVIEKAQNLVTLISGDNKICSPSPPLENVLQLYNVSTQVDIKEPIIHELCSKRDIQQNTEPTSCQNEETVTILSDTKSLASECNEIIFNEESDASLDVVEDQKTPDDKLRKLSLHLLPPVQIGRELVTQKIPNININSEESTLKNDVNNVGFQAVKHDSSEDQKLFKLIDIVKGLKNQNKSNAKADILPDDDQKVVTSCDAPHKNEHGSLNGSEHIETPLKRISNSIYPTITNKIVQVLQDPEAQYMCQSYQVLDNGEVRESSSLPEIDTKALSLIDDDVYKTYVNPEGKKSQTDSKSNKSVGSININSNEKMLTQNKTSIAEVPEPDTRKSNSSLSLVLDAGSKASINSILIRNRESLNEFMGANSFNRGPHSYFTDSAPLSVNSKQLTIKNNTKSETQPLNKNIDVLTRSNSVVSKKLPKDIPAAVKIDSAVSANIKDYMSHPRARLSIERLKDIPTFDQIYAEPKFSKVSKGSDKDLSDSTEKMILSIDKLEIRRKSGFYGNEEKKLSLFDVPDLSSKRQFSARKKSLNKMRKSSFKSYDSSNEEILMRDMRMQTISAVALVDEQEQSKTSKESSGTYNTDDSLKIAHYTDSFDEPKGYCSYCTKLCFRKKRSVFQDDAYKATGHQSSVQFLQNSESRIRSDVSEPKCVAQNKDDINYERKTSLSEHRSKVQSRDVINDTSGEQRGRAMSDQRGKQSEDLNLSVSSDNTERRRSVKIEVPTQRSNLEVEGFIKGLTNSSSHLISSIASPNYTKADMIGFIKKSSQEWNQYLDENKKKHTVMSVNVDQPIIDLNEKVKGGEGDKSSLQFKSNEELPLLSNEKETDSKDKVVEDVRVILFTNVEENAKRSTMKDECQQSDGEILNKSDRSIGEVHLCAGHPENLFIRDLRRSHKRIVNRKVQNLNWISYYVKPIRRYTAHAPVPVNDSSDSMS